MQLYKPRYFKLYELVPPKIYEELGQRAWILLDPNILEIADFMRDRYGPATINDWKWGGKFKYSGFRPAGCKVGAKYSQHRYGRALDMKFKLYTAEEVRQDIKTWTRFAHPIDKLGAIEEKVSWLHADVRVTQSSKIKWIR